MPTANFLRQAARGTRIALEILVLSALVLGTRCANREDVFVGGRIYFVDVDCYSRMTRARMVAQHPGLVVRHHDFENYPDGVTPHTTALLDYLIVALGAALRPFTAQPLDLAGAIVSPLLALVGGLFLYWWLRPAAWPARYAALLIYSGSGILAQGTALGRPDHQALLIVTLLVALAAEWRLQRNPTRGWSIASGISWGLALWISLYEPLILLAALLLVSAIAGRAQLLARPRRLGWWILLGVVLVAAFLERRWPQWPATEPFFVHWSATIGELQSVGLTNPEWLYWGGGFLLFAPFLLPLARRGRDVPVVIVALLALSFLLTLWEVRWSYFFVLIFALTIPAQFAVVRQKWLAALLLALGLLPFLQFWDAVFWPNEEVAAHRSESRNEMREWRAAAGSLGGQPRGAILAPWWLSPATAYWSGQPVVAGSSHESLPGVVDSARFFLTSSTEEARAILCRHRVRWVLAYDGDRLAENSAATLGVAPPPPSAFCWRLDRFPSQAPPFLRLSGQNGTCKTYQVRDLP